MTLRSTVQDARPAVRIGMLGYGFMAKAHSNAFKTMPYMFWPGGAQTELHTICGRSEARVSEAATRYGFDRFTTDWRDLVDDPDVQIFDNVGPDEMHVEPTLAAIGAGKHVICEKPLALTLSEAVELQEAAQRAGVKNLTCFNYRFVPAVRLAHDMIASGEIGDIYNANFHYAQDWRTPAGIELPSATGALSIIGCHAVDQARYLVGEIEAVSAITTNPATPADRAEPVDSVFALTEFSSGAAGTIGASLVSRGRKNLLGWEINGSKGSLAWNLEELNLLRVYRADHGRAPGFSDVIVCEAEHPLVAPWWPSGHVLGWEHAHINMLAHFVEAVVTDEPVGPDAATFVDGAKAAAVAEAITQAAATGNRTLIASVLPETVGPVVPDLVGPDGR